MWSLISTGSPGSRSALIEPQAFVSTTSVHARRDRGAHAVRDRGDAVPLVQVRAAEEDEHSLPAPLDGVDPAFVSRDGGGRETGQVGRGERRGRARRGFRGPLPARAEHERDVEAVDSGAGAQLVGGFSRGVQWVAHGRVGYGLDGRGTRVRRGSTMTLLARVTA